MMCDRHLADLQALVRPECPFWCLSPFLPPAAWHPLRDGLRDRGPDWPAVAEITRMYQRGELAGFHGLGPRRLAAIGHFLTQAGLLPPTGIPGLTWLTTAVLTALRSADRTLTACEVADRLNVAQPVKPRTVAINLSVLYTAGLASREWNPSHGVWSYQATSGPSAWLPPSLSPLPRAVLAALWQSHRPLTIAELAGQLGDHLAGLPCSPYDTVAATVESLRAQDLIHRCHDGRSWRYTTARAPSQDSPAHLTLVLPGDLSQDVVFKGLVDAIGHARADLAERARAFHHHSKQYATAASPLQQGISQGLALASQYAVCAIDEAITATFDLWHQYSTQPGPAAGVNPSPPRKPTAGS
jgi:Fe2+ or Zn2+ uptake regulation protein